MSTHFKQFLTLLIVVGTGFLTSANAQRGGDHRNGGGWSDRSSNSRGSGFEQRSFSSGRDNNSFNRQSSWNRQTPSTINRQSSSNQQAGRVSSDPARDNARNLVLGPGNVDRSRGTGTAYNNYRYNNGYRYNNNYSYNYPKVYTYPRYNYVPRRYVYVGAPRYSYLPHSFINIQFGGYPYYYNSGLFYSYYNGFYEPVYAPIGIHVGILPLGYRTFFMGSDPYYYYGGTYYRNVGNEYEVVDAPIGAEISSLPTDAKAVTVNGEKFYEFNGTYYKEGTNNKNEVVYTVVGKYGEINNTQVQSSNGLPNALRSGDIVPNLPEGCKEVTINGETLYLSPNNIYFKALNGENGVSYQVVGM